MFKNRLQQLLAQNVATGGGVRATRNDASQALDLFIYDVIDPWYGVSAKAVASALAGAGVSPLAIHINSPGGDVFEARAIASLIRAHPGPTSAVIDGLAASAASTIAMAAGSLAMAKGSFLMIHQSWAFAMDNAPGLRTLADLLEKVDGQIAADYATKAGVPVQDALAWMAAETWFTAEEAVTAKLADTVLDAEGEMQAFNLAAFDRTPQALINKIAALKSVNLADVQTIRDATERRMRLFEMSA